MKLRKRRFGQSLNRVTSPSLRGKAARGGPAGGLRLEYAEHSRPAPAHEGTHGPLVQERIFYSVYHRVNCRGHLLKVIMEPQGDISEIKPCNFITVAFFCQPQ